MGTCSQPGYVFGIFVLNRVLILSIFVLNLGYQEPITQFLDDEKPALMSRYKCLKLGIKNRKKIRAFGSRIGYHFSGD